jgi:uncharacterized CHY-type Zn-finger protein
MRAHVGDPHGAGPVVHGVDVDDRGRCAHFHEPGDIVSIRFACCGRYFACHLCHAQLADHTAERWPPLAFHVEAVLCGACRTELTIDDYLASSTRCPQCGADFDAALAVHHPFYFAIYHGTGRYDVELYGTSELIDGRGSSG